MTATNSFFRWFYYGLDGLGGWFLFFLVALGVVIWLLYDSYRRRLPALGWRMGIIIAALLLVPAILYRFTITSLDDLARYAGSSPYRLCRIFRAHTGQSIRAYRSQLRLRAAFDRLLQGADITDLALELGFSSHSHFTAAFRSRFGTSPSRLRAEFAGEGDDVTPRAVRPLCSARGGAVDWKWS